MIKNTSQQRCHMTDGIFNKLSTIEQKIKHHQNSSQQMILPESVAADEKIKPLQPSTLAGIVAGLTAGALWGLVFVAPKVVNEFTPADLTAARFLAYGIFALGILLFRRKTTSKPVLFSHLQVAFGLSLLGFTGKTSALVLIKGRAATERFAGLPSLFRQECVRHIPREFPVVATAGGSSVKGTALAHQL